MPSPAAYVFAGQDVQYEAPAKGATLPSAQAEQTGAGKYCVPASTVSAELAYVPLGQVVVKGPGTLNVVGNTFL
jgi:hypothetical protein